jgi:hypothetical protein
MSTTTLRARNSIAKAERRAAMATNALKLKEKGYSNVEIGKKLGGIPESSVRALLKPTLKQRAESTKVIANLIKDNIEKKGYLDVGTGVEFQLGVSRTKLDTALQLLREEGYPVMYGSVLQLGTGKNTSLRVIGPKDTGYSEFGKNKHNITQIVDTSKDNGMTVLNMKYPASIDSKRIAIRYDEDGGSLKDGVIELRPGVDDISLGKSRYAQVRIAVDNTHYLKGMAMYGDDIPPGKDIVFNTNKSKDTPKMKVLKAMQTDVITKEIDKDNPFGASIKANGQSTYIDKNGIERQSVINKVNEEGDWFEWQDNHWQRISGKPEFLNGVVNFALG